MTYAYEMETEWLSRRSPRVQGCARGARPIGFAACTMRRFKVFRERGYDAATTREIALEAAVSVGTVFVYARDKRDLLFMVVNDDLDAVLARARVAARQPAPLLDQLLALLAPIYAYFASEPALARGMLLEVVHHHGLQEPPGDQALRYARRMGNLDARDCRACCARRATPATCASTFDPALMAQILWDLHLIEVRRWMAADDPQAAVGQAGLRRLYEAVLEPRVGPGPHPLNRPALGEPIRRQPPRLGPLAEPVAQNQSPCASSHQAASSAPSAKVNTRASRIPTVAVALQHHAGAAGAARAPRSAGTPAACGCRRRRPSGRPPPTGTAPPFRPGAR